ncbi:hypothetical protein DFS34DRAFT_655638 [Phlyctochytrium arcticum]|nr:hypothetical protein DFS34DRAFT_655638 [Phlyctochytrium arcticum]
MSVEDDSKSRDPLRIAIIGAGLGGLLLYRILSHHLETSHINHPPFTLTIYERDPSASSRGQGYVIGLNPDGLAALSRGFTKDDELTCQLGTAADMVFFMTDQYLKVLMKVVESGHGKSIAVDRWTLRDALATDIPVQWGKRFDSYQLASPSSSSSTDFHALRVVFDDGTSIVSDLVIGADGNKSKLCSQRCSNKITIEEIPVAGIAGSLLYTDAVAQSPKLHSLSETGFIRALGTGGVSMLVIHYTGEPSCPTPGQKRIVWVLNFLTDPAKMAEYDTTFADPDKTHAVAVDMIKTHFAPESELVGLVSSTRTQDFFPTTRVLRSALFSCANPLAHPSTTDQTGPWNVTLLGDAAHAMTTHRGLGANTAFQDAVDLADAIIKSFTDSGSSTSSTPQLLQTNLAAYSTVMFKRGIAATKASKQSSNMMTTSGFGAKIRNTFMGVLGTIMSWTEKRKK